MERRCLLICKEDFMGQHLKSEMEMVVGVHRIPKVEREVLPLSVL